MNAARATILSVTCILLCCSVHDEGRPSARSSAETLAVHSFVDRLRTDFRGFGSASTGPRLERLPSGYLRPANGFAIELPPIADRDTEVRGTNGVGTRFHLRGARPVHALVGEEGALYPDILDHVDALARATSGGAEDFVYFRSRPADESIEYTVDVSKAAGLRLLNDTLEFLDAAGAPRLRIQPPYVLDSSGARVAAHLGVVDCAYDSDARAPWDRAVTAPGSATCGVRVTWQGVVYPALVDPLWSSTGSMVFARYQHTATLLLNGKVLVAGGAPNEPTTELYDPATQTFAQGPGLQAGRGRHRATLLGSGNVLLTGGQGTNTLQFAEVYDGTKFTLVFGSSPVRDGHTATILPSGKVLIAGGTNGTNYLTTTRIYDPGSAPGSLAIGPPLLAPRTYAEAVSLPSGKVFIVGGAGSSGATNTAETYDEPSNAFTASANVMSKARSTPSATLLPTGKVLVVGGTVGTGSYLASSELYDPATDTFSLSGSMAAVRTGHTATLLPSGSVLVAGGFTQTKLATADLYTNGTFVTAGTMAVARFGNTATLLPNGKVLVTGGIDTNPTTNAQLFALGANGGTCSTANECASGFCVDGVCCESACSGQCEACDVGGGTCTAVTGAPHGTRAACGGSGSLCEGACDGAQRSACTYPSSSTNCTACASASVVSGSCNGAGKCNGPASECAGHLTCATATKCKTVCASKADCTSGYVCGSGGSCVPDATCVDTHTSQSGNGPPVECAPYLCAGAGVCGTACSTSDECLTGNVCTQNACVPAATPPTDGGGGCNASGGTPSVGWLGALLLVVTRRRRTAQRT